MGASAQKKDMSLWIAITNDAFDFKQFWKMKTHLNFLLSILFCCILTGNSFGLCCLYVVKIEIVKESGKPKALVFHNLEMRLEITPLMMMKNHSLSFNLVDFGLIFAGIF